LTEVFINTIITAMNNHIMSRKHLETLSSADLILLADEYGIDIPEDLSRRFIIAELLDIAREMQEDEGAGLAITGEALEEWELPLSYNETAVCAVHSNPVWLYVFWDISASDRARIDAGRQQAALILRVTMLERGGKIAPRESFDVPVSVSDIDQHILLPASADDEKNIRVELILETQTEKPRLLAVSAPVPLSRPCPDFRESFLSEQSPLLELSGFKELMRTHFLKHRQSFF
jgi:hypothetical protein